MADPGEEMDQIEAFLEANEILNDRIEALEAERDSLRGALLQIQGATVDMEIRAITDTALGCFP